MERFDHTYDFNDIDQGQLGDPQVIGITNPKDAKDIQQADHKKLHSLLKLSIQNSGSSFWRESIILARMLWLGKFITQNPSGRDSYPRTRMGLVDYLHDQKIPLSPDDVNKRLKIYATFVKHSVKHPEVLDKIKKIGMSKAYAATVYVTAENVVDLLDAILDRNIPHSNLRIELSKMYPREHRQRRKSNPNQLRQEKEQRAIDVIEGSPRLGNSANGGVILDKTMFIPRSDRLNVEEESWLYEVFEAGRKEKDMTIDQFMMELGKFVYDKWLTEDDQNQIDSKTGYEGRKNLKPQKHLKVVK